ncbi:MAG: hypothetical protein ACOC0C_00770 [Bacteroidota bacterium]
MKKPEGPSEEDKGRFYDGWRQLMEEFRDVLKESEKYKARREEFQHQFTKEVIELTLDFVHELVVDKELLFREMFEYALLIFEDVSELLYHYEEGKPGYRFGLFEPDFEVYTMPEAAKNKILKPIKKQETWELLNENWRKDYAECVYLKTYEYHIFKLLKKLIPEYQKEVFNLPSQGFLELEGLLYIQMLDIFEIVRETQHGEPYFTDEKI